MPYLPRSLDPHCSGALRAASGGVAAMETGVGGATTRRGAGCRSHCADQHRSDHGHMLGEELWQRCWIKPALPAPTRLFSPASQTPASLTILAQVCAHVARRSTSWRWGSCGAHGSPPGPHAGALARIADPRRLPEVECGAGAGRGAGPLPTIDLGRVLHAFANARFWAASGRWKRASTRTSPTTLRRSKR